MKGLMQSNLFNVQEIVRINEEIKAAEHEKANLEARKKLELPYYDNPVNDNELLFNYQYDYIKNNSSDAWGKMIDLTFKVMQKLVWRRMAQDKLKLDENEQFEKISEASYYFLRRYQTRIGYCITTNFIVNLDMALDHALKYTTKLEMNTVYTEDLQREKKLI